MIDTAFPEILEEITQALESPREADGSWAREGRRRAHDRQAKLPGVFMAHLVARSPPSLVAELLADLAVQSGAAEDRDATKLAYWSRLTGWAAA